MTTTTTTPIEISNLALPVALDSYHIPLRVLCGTPSDDPAVQQLLAELEQALAGGFLDRSAAFMKYRGHALKRSKAFFVDSPTVNAAGEPEQLFLYRYPGFQHESLLHYRAASSVPPVQRLLREFAERYTFQGQPLVFNHVIATEYRDHTDNIGWHSDEMQDITPGTPIVSLSLGAARTLELRPTPAEPAAADAHDLVTGIKLQHGDVFVLGPQTNTLMQHRVPPEALTTAGMQPRISLVFRHIVTKATRVEVEAVVDRARAAKERKRAREEAAAAVDLPPPQRFRYDCL